jgi:hypothetical protein
MSKIPNELLEAMKKASHKTTFNDSFKVTDFTPKKKTPFKIRLKNSIKKFFNRFKKSKFLMKIKNWYYNNIKKPIQDKKEEKDKLRYVKELKENFSKKFNVDVEKTIRVMNQPAYSPPNVDDNALLIQNRIEINKTKVILGNRISPFLYEPDIIDIHNENINLNDGNPTFEELVRIENMKASTSVNKQHEFFNKRPHLTVGGRKRNR